jgi:hypothetical protein
MSLRWRMLGLVKWRGRPGVLFRWALCGLGLHRWSTFGATRWCVRPGCGASKVEHKGARRLPPASGRTREAG